MPLYTNALITENSPYLLQHSHNPVNWFPWDQKYLTKAKKENKLLLISIGYAACHWCHVMEHECFEDEDVAQVMNDYFINIKVDREERPDVDQVYMSAVQIMTGRGGWPLNVVSLPDGRPIWGGTYIPKKQWVGSLHQLADLYKQEPQKLVEYAEKLEEGIHQVSLIEKNDDAISFSTATLTQAVQLWKNHFDHTYGGRQGAPKFMMPNNYQFLMRYAYQLNDSAVMKHVNTTLTHMAYGGLYDHVGGGFSRYSVDEKWHVPHFEKMLYDNAQLVSLYSDAYLLTKNDLYKSVVKDTLKFIKRELTRPNGSFYSSLDADSKTKTGQLEEGAYYVWTKDELETILEEDFEMFKVVYNINEKGYWEEGKYVLIRDVPLNTIASKFKCSIAHITDKINHCKSKLLQARQNRSKPRLDDKALTSWNALMLKAYLDAYRVFQEEEYLNIALKNAEFLKRTMLNEDGRLWHSYNNERAKTNGFLDDYALVIEAFIALYSLTQDEEWLELSKTLTTYAIGHFYSEDNGMFFYTSSVDDALITRPIEYQDNVIPASNSIMAKNLFKLAHLLGDMKYNTIAKQMLHNILKELERYPSGYGNWLDLMLNYTEKYFELVIVGDQAYNKQKELYNYYMPNVLVAASRTRSENHLLKNRYVAGKTLLYVCENSVCKTPAASIEEALSNLSIQG